MERFEEVNEETKMYMNLMHVKFYEAFLDKHSTNIADVKCPAFFVSLYSSTIDKAFSLLRKICNIDMLYGEIAHSVGRTIRDKIY
jgi:hypothetical protein